jgi:ubiquinone/menaquinone biosynthesis C-methylase UbiE
MTRRRRTPIDWTAYLATFHTQRPGITETVLTRCRYDGHNPYEWLLQGVSTSATVLDLACGSAPTRPRFSTGWIGIDRSVAELTAARLHGARDLALADITELPCAPATFDVVVCSMALMLVTPLDKALREIARVIRPGGTLQILLPTTRPLTWSDRARYTRLAMALRTTPQFPATPLKHQARQAFAHAGFTITGNEHRRYSYPITNAEDAYRFIDSLYLPAVSPQRRQQAHARAERMLGHEIGIPLRKIAATLNA